MGWWVLLVTWVTVFPVYDHVSGHDYDDYYDDYHDDYFDGGMGLF